MNNYDLISIENKGIKNKIHTVKGVQVILDSDLARLYDVETKQLNQAVKRNINRFPKDFMFQLDEREFIFLKSQFVTSDGKGGRRYLPFVFTEQGVAMLSGILNSKVAIKMSIQIINTFVNMRKIINSNNLFIQRLENIERKQLEYDIKFDKLFNLFESDNIKKKEGIFFDGQIFDSHIFISDLIRSASKSIILIDNFIDDSVLTLFTKCKNEVGIIIYTKEISKQLRLDLKKFNSQYRPIIIKEFDFSHDRFIIIDDKELYHIGASLKDLGKKWFAFSKLHTNSIDILNIINKLKARD